MKKGEPGYTAYKIASNLGNGYITLGSLNLITMIMFILSASRDSIFFFLIPLGAALLYILSFVYLIILYAIKKLSEVTGNKELRTGINFVAISLVIIFFGIPLISYSAYISPILSLIVVGLLFFVAFLFLLGHYYLFYGLGEYGKIERSPNIVKASMFIVLLLVVEFMVFVPIFFISISFEGVVDFELYYGLSFIATVIGLIESILLIILGREFDRIANKIKTIVLTKNLKELKESVKGKSIEEIIKISRESEVPFVLLASLRM